MQGQLRSVPIRQSEACLSDDAIRPFEAGCAVMRFVVLHVFETICCCRSNRGLEPA